MRSLFVVPCKNVAGRSVVVECVRRIRLHHPDTSIVVVDSDSDDKTYFAEVEDAGAQVDDVKNLFYATGAQRHAYDNYRAEIFHFIGDSIWLNAPLPDPDPLLTVRWFSGARHPWGWDRNGVDLAVWGAPHLERMGVVPADYCGVLGPYFSCQSVIADRLAAIGYFDCDPADKWQQCGMERICGIVLAHLGYDVSVSVQGEHCGHWDRYDESVVTKLEMGRP